MNQQRQPRKRETGPLAFSLWVGLIIAPCGCLLEKATDVEVGSPRVGQREVAVLLGAGTRREYFYLNEQAAVNLQGHGANGEQGQHADLIRVGQEDGAGKTIRLERAKYVKPHLVGNHDPTSGKEVLSELEDVANLIVVNGEWLAFSIDVVGSAWHTGHIEGAVRIENDRAVYIDDWEPTCTLTFDLRDRSRVRIDEHNDACGHYHGGRVRFTGTFERRKHSTVRWPT